MDVNEVVDGALLLDDDVHDVGHHDYASDVHDVHDERHEHDEKHEDASCHANMHQHTHHDEQHLVAHEPSY